MALPLTPSEAVAAFAPLSRFPRLALAVSGGADSMAMLHLIARWRLEGAGKPELTVLTVDHGLRAGSRAEAEMVAGMAKGLGLRHAILTWMRDEPPRPRTAHADMMPSGVPPVPIRASMPEPGMAATKAPATSPAG